MTTTDHTPLAEQPSVRWCGRDDAHPAHEKPNEFGGTDYCTGMSEAAAARGQAPLGERTPLAEQIAREHYLTTHAKCACPDAIDAGRDAHAWVAHIATVTEQAVRERMRAAGPTLEIHAWGATPEQADTIFTAAMDAAYDAAPEGVAVDAVGKLAGRGTASPEGDTHA